MKAPRFPQRLLFPFGYRVPVVWKGRIKNADGTTFYYDGACPSHVEMDASVPLWRKYQVFAHEVVHVANDYALWIQMNIVEPLKAEAERTEKELEEHDDHT